jgi:hypothetical protein
VYSVATDPRSNKKQDRSTLPTVAAILGCVVSAYGFSKGNVWLQWVVPVAMIAAACAVVFRPRRGGGGAPPAA